MRLKTLLRFTNIWCLSRLLASKRFRLSELCHYFSSCSVNIFSEPPLPRFRLTLGGKTWKRKFDKTLTSVCTRRGRGEWKNTVGWSRSWRKNWRITKSTFTLRLTHDVQWKKNSIVWIAPDKASLVYNTLQIKTIFYYITNTLAFTKPTIQKMSEWLRKYKWGMGGGDKQTIWKFVFLKQFQFGIFGKWLAYLFLSNIPRQK